MKTMLIIGCFILAFIEVLVTILTLGLIRTKFALKLHKKIKY